MKINAELVRKLRKEKSWSQDELALVSGLNLRTVQRIEKEASTSLQSKKSLASAFDINIRDLDSKDKPMKIKMFTKLNPKNKVEPINNEFESEINEWLNKNPTIEVKHIQQSAGAGSMGPFIFFITVWYEE